ncbi:MAG: NTP transferase domain-containing protein [Deltaproteobacteria bacterium]|nr:NTP transferase domain-containing protein [Deltaproteobacteria bacterium]
MEREKIPQVGSLIFAAGRGSRMKGYEGNKVLLPLLPGPDPYAGARPILLHILENLPLGPKAVVVHHQKEDIFKATTEAKDLAFFEQPVLNGTGGALLAAEDFLRQDSFEQVIITMGDVPFVKRDTYLNLVRALDTVQLAVLGFLPEHRRQYGVLETEGRYVKRIIEWTYWKEFPKEQRDPLRICNSGIYAARRKDLLAYVPLLGQKGHVVHKERGGKVVELEEFFITDLVEMMDRDGLRVGHVLARDEEEVMGLDDLSSLLRAQEIYASSRPASS